MYDILTQATGVSDQELRFASQHLKAAIEQLKLARHYVSGSLLEARISTAQADLGQTHFDVGFIRKLAERIAGEPVSATSLATTHPNGVVEQHSRGVFSGPQHNAQSIPKNPETT